MNDDHLFHSGGSTEPSSLLTEPSTGSPGTILRRCREFHEISLEEASETTKIGISHLKALEEDRIKDFANQAYLKGFLRIYATYLGLNSDDIARMYEKLFGVKDDIDQSRFAATPHTPHNRIIALKKLLFPALLLIIIMITAVFFRSPSSPVPRQPATTVAVIPAQSIVIQSPLSSVRVRKIEKELPAEKTEKQPRQLPEIEAPAPIQHSAAPSKGFVLKIKATQNGSLTVNIDGVSSQQHELTSGDIIEWKADKKITLELSNAGGIEVELNGKPYKPLGALGKPAYVEFDAEGIKQ